MSFLEECRKAEDEDGVGKVKPKGKIKVVAATTTTSSPSYNDAFYKQLKKQQQFDALMSNIQTMVTTLTVTQSPGHILISPGEPFIWDEG